MSAQDPSQLRISDDDRHRVAEFLRESAGEGRIDLAELDERLEQTYAAKTYADLVPITLDLPAGPGSTPAVPVAPGSAEVPGARPAYALAGRASENHLAVMSGVDRKGVWTVPERMTVTCLMGGADLDMREALFSAREVVVTVNAFMGGATITVGPTTNVVVEGIGIMGGYSGPSGRSPVELTPDSPTVRVRGVAIWGGVSVVRKPPKPPRRRRGR